MPKSDLSAMMIGGSKIWTHNLRTAVQNNCLEFTNGDIFHPLPCQGRHNILCLFASTPVYEALVFVCFNVSLFLAIDLNNDRYAYAKVCINMQFPWCLCELWWYTMTPLPTTLLSVSALLGLQRLCLP